MTFPERNMSMLIAAAILLGARVEWNSLTESAQYRPYNPASASLWENAARLRKEIRAQPIPENEIERHRQKFQQEKILKIIKCMEDLAKERDKQMETELDKERERKFDGLERRLRGQQ